MVRASFYDEEGLPRFQQTSLRVMGENLAADYALFRLLESKTKPSEAYQSEKISSFLHKTIHADGRFYSYASPMKAFISVPFLYLPYNSFCETWIFWGLFLSGISLYTLLPLKVSLLLIFAFPAVFLSFISGGWGVFLASAVVLSLTLSEAYPKSAGFFAALCMVEPIAFILLTATFFFRRQFKAALTAVCSGIAFIGAGWARYGLEAFEEAFKSAWQVFSETPCLLSSFSSALMCSGLPLALSVVLQTALVFAVVYFGIRVFHNTACSQSVQDAYLCAALCLISPFTSLGDYGLLYAGVAFLMRDQEARGVLKGEVPFLLTAFLSIYLESFWIRLSGASLQLFLAVVLLWISYRRSR
ncbi:MAG: DUF2029 domain-containing protein [Alphaproteobacteria bacterium]|nr:DUF2029 domain-containing protein [Alphaproteobacteria bacterium]